MQSGKTLTNQLSRQLLGTEPKVGDMFHELVHNSRNRKINAEFAAWYGDLGMAAWCSGKHLHGCAKWLRGGAREEHSHAMNLYEFLVSQNLNVQMVPLDVPRTEVAPGEFRERGMCHDVMI